MSEKMSGEEYARLYEQNIPACCSLKTAKEHMDELLGCWGLMSAIKGGYQMQCGDCEMRNVDDGSQ